MTLIRLCTCRHAYQDATYGPFMRVHNYALKGNNGNPGWRCTVCLSVKPVSSTKPTEEKK